MRLLNKESGLLGISGVSHDLREIGEAIAQGNKRAKLAQDMYLHRLKACFGSMLMSLGGGGCCCIYGGAGMGEHAAGIRAAACEGMAFLGVELDLEENAKAPVDRDIATAESEVRVLVIHTQEDWAIAQDCWQYVESNC